MSLEAEVSSIEYDIGEGSDCGDGSFSPNEVHDESAWSKTAISFLLEECLKRQKEFHNPRHRNHKFFSEVRDSMIPRGFVFNAKTLEKKFYNLKKHFFTICKNRERDSSPTKPITWPYYAQMMKMFAEEMDIDDAPTMASLYPDTSFTQTLTISPNVEGQSRLMNYSDEDSELKYENGDEESRWQHKSVMAFLNECCKRKHDLWDPKIRRRKIFCEISCRLKEKGFFFYQESLDRKLRNMKKQFQVVNDTMQRNKISRNGKRRRITWPYYEKLQELYGAEIEKENRRKKALRDYTESLSQKPSTLAVKFRHIAPKPEEPAATVVSQPSNKATLSSLQAKETPATISTPSPILLQDDGNTLPTEGRPETQTTDAKHEDEKLKFMRQVLAFEERRTIVAEEMLAEMRESNKIRERRLEFTRIKLEFATRKKRKKNGSV